MMAGMFLSYYCPISTFTIENQRVSCGIKKLVLLKRDEDMVSIFMAKRLKYKSEVVKKVKSTFFFTIFGRFEMP